MKRAINTIGNLLVLLVLLVLGIGLVALLRGTFPITGEQPASPVVTPTVLLLSPLPTPTPVPTALPPVTPGTIPPPPGWPTDQPWPPTPVTPPPPPPTVAPQPFPTPRFQPTPGGTPPARLQTVWFPFFPAPGSSPRLRAVQVDDQGRRWAQTEQAIDLGLRPDFPGPYLLNLHPSPDRQLLVADLAYGESNHSTIVSPSTGTSQPVYSGNPARFLAWAPDSQHVVIFSPGFPQEVWLLDIATQEHEALALPMSDSGYSLVGAAAYSPDGTLLADASVYPPSVSQPNPETEIGLTTLDQGTRTSLARLTGDQVIPHSLLWSPDDRSLVFVIVVGATYDADPANDDIQLWMVDQADGALRLLATGLAPRPAAWSPDGQYIAYLKGDALYLLDLATSEEQLITRFANRQIQHWAWSPDGSRLAVSLSIRDYGEILIMSRDGTQQYPIAGPTVLDAPFVWLP